jgi:hypothetical protein
MQRMHRAAPGIAIAAALALLATTAGAVLGHEERQVGPYTVVVGFIDEPVFVGQKSGLELFVGRGAGENGQPVEGLEATLQAEVIVGDAMRQLALAPRFGAPGWYQAYFFPTEAGAYTFHITGTIEDEQVDESFTSSPEGFGEVEEVSSAQFPVQLPAAAELADQAGRGADAAGLVPVALVTGIAGLVAGLAGLGLALGARRRAP